MTMSELAGNTLNSAAGNIQRGIIEIIDLRNPNGSMVIPKEPVKAGGVTLTKDAASLIDAASGSAAKAVAGSTVGKLFENDTLMDNIGMLGRIPTVAGVSNVSRKQFTVQFNPSEIRLSGYGGGMFSKIEYGQDQQSKVVFEAMKPRITLDLNLIFDESDPLKTFMGAPFSLAPSSAVKTATEGIRKLGGFGKTVTVQDKVEAFSAALRNTRTRFVTFHWGNMNYSGTLIRVSAQYTMFDMTGVPVRARMGLSIVCIDDQAKLSDTIEWKNYYKKAFGTDGSLAGAATKATSAVGNILNINL